MSSARIYPARLAPRERKLLGDALAVLPARGNPDEDDVARAISHRLACATRYDEMREKRLTAFERSITASTLRHAITDEIRTPHPDASIYSADVVRSLTRALVRLLR